MKSRILWPENCDKMIGEGEGRRCVASVVRNRLDWMIMSGGYMLSAELAVKNCAWHSRNLIVFPVVYQCRHAIELAIKHTLNIAERAHCEPETKFTNHRICPIWKKLKPLLKRTWTSDRSEALSEVEATLKALDAIDPEAVGFRFPADRNGKPILTDETNVDLKQLVDTSKEIIDFLSGCSEAYADQLDRMTDRHH